MIGMIFKWALKTVVGRWVTGLLIASLLSGAAIKWYNFKKDLIAEGQTACIQEINKETVEQLQLALADAKSARAELTARLLAVAAVEAQARARHQDAQTQVTALQNQIKEQRKNDETYRAWSDTTLPDGVGNRLRAAQATGDPSTVRDNSN